MRRGDIKIGRGIAIADEQRPVRRRIDREDAGRTVAAGEGAGADVGIFYLDSALAVLTDKGDLDRLVSDR